jgi:8-oxo-dGTP diphosphatase
MKVVVKALVIDKDNDVLLLRRSGTHPHFAHHVDFPGGEVEAGETYVLAVKREILEETGVEVALGDLGLVYQKYKPDEDTVDVVYAVRLSSKLPVRLSLEHESFEWVAFNRLRSIPIPNGVDTYHLTVLEYLATL